MRREPLLVRPGTRYRCFGDGLCCSDIHAIGPIDEREALRLQVVDERVVAFDEEMQGFVMTMDARGCCHFLGEDGCSLHAEMGGLLKPTSCRRFPLGLTATPDGGRVTSDHRCPCRTMGERPEVTVETARPALVDEDGRLRTAFEVADEIAWDDEGAFVSFDVYQAHEEKILAALAAARPPREALGGEAMPPLEDSSWEELATKMHLASGSERFQAMVRYCGAALLEVPEEPPRPWRDAFDRAEARSPEVGDPEAMLREWIADTLWALHWTDQTGYHRLRHDLTTRAAIARRVAERLRAQDVRLDRAMAESLSIVDSVTTSDWWALVVSAMIVT